MSESELWAASVVPAPRSVRGVRRRLVEHLSVPLHRDGYALALNSAFTAVSGLLYWILAARSYSPHAVGLNAALISSMMFLSGIASLNLPNILVRFLPQSGARTRSHVIWAYGISGTFALCVGAVFVIGVGRWAPRLGFLRADHGLQSWFLCSTLAWCLFVSQDSVLTALGRAVWVPVENAVFSLLKLALLAALAAVVPLYGIFISWTLAMLVSVIGVNVVIFTRLIGSACERAGTSAVSLRDRAFARYFTTDYACSIASLSTANLLPVIITALAGATTNAYWAMAYAITLPLYAFGQNIGTSLLLHASVDRAALPALTRKAAIQGARVLVPIAVLLVALAPVLLSLLGTAYAAHGAMLLRLLILGTLPNFVISLAVSVARVQRRLRRAFLALAGEAVIVLGAAPPLLRALGVSGVGLAWLAGQCLVAGGLALTWRSALAHSNELGGREPAGAELPAANGELALVSPARPPRASSARRASGGAPVALHPLLEALFSACERHGVQWTLLRMPADPAAPAGDIDILVAPADALTLRALAAELGFVAVPGWERPPELILVCYDRPSDCWLVLDVATAVVFRSQRGWWLMDGAEQVLARRRQLAELVVPADEDAFWLLVLHCLLDKRRVAEHHRATLQRLAAAGRRSPLGAAACTAAGVHLRPGRFVEAARRADWDQLGALGAELASALARRRTVRERLRVSSRELARLARKPLLLARRRGVSIALLGPNGVGKSTAAAGLQRSLPFQSRVIYMGVWKAADRERGAAAAALEILLRPLVIWRRYLIAQYHELRGRVVLFDRYVYEALLPSRPPLLAAKRAYHSLLAHSIPPAGATAVLDVPGAVAYARKQENPAHVLEAERHLYASLAGRVRSLTLIDAGKDSDTVRAELTAILWRALVARWQGRRGLS